MRSYFSASMVAVREFAGEVRINETHIGAARPTLNGSPQQGKITPTVAAPRPWPSFPSSPFPSFPLVERPVRAPAGRTPFF